MNIVAAVLGMMSDGSAIKRSAVAKSLSSIAGAHEIEIAFERAQRYKMIESVRKGYYLLSTIIPPAVDPYISNTDLGVYLIDTIDIRCNKIKLSDLACEGPYWEKRFFSLVRFGILVRVGVSGFPLEHEYEINARPGLLDLLAKRAFPKAPSRVHLVLQAGLELGTFGARELKWVCDEVEGDKSRGIGDLTRRMVRLGLLDLIERSPVGVYRLSALSNLLVRAHGRTPIGANEVVAARKWANAQARVPSLALAWNARRKSNLNKA